MWMQIEAWAKIGKWSLATHLWSIVGQFFGAQRGKKLFLCLLQKGNTLQLPMHPRKLSGSANSFPSSSALLSPLQLYSVIINPKLHSSRSISISNYAHMKHIDVCFHFIQWIVEEGKLQLIYCPAAEMVADVLTKALMWSFFLRSLVSVCLEECWKVKIPRSLGLLVHKYKMYKMCKALFSWWVLCLCL